MNFTNWTYPDDFYESNVYKMCGIVASLLNICIVTPLVYFIIWYDKKVYFTSEKMFGIKYNAKTYIVEHYLMVFI